MFLCPNSIRQSRSTLTAHYIPLHYSNSWSLLYSDLLLPLPVADPDPVVHYVLTRLLGWMQLVLCFLPPYTIIGTCSILKWEFPLLSDVDITSLAQCTDCSPSS